MSAEPDGGSLGMGPGGSPGRGRLLALTPLRLEARAVVAGAPRATVVRTGMGPDRSGRVARRLAPVQDRDVAAVAVLGVCGALRDDLRPGDVVVADAVIDSNGQPVVAYLPPADVLARALAEAGLRTYIGAMASSRHLVRGRNARTSMLRNGAIAVEMEGAAVLGEAWGRPAVMVRTVSDTAGAELLSVATIPGGLAALRSLRAAAAVIDAWAASIPIRTVSRADPSATP